MRLPWGQGEGVMPAGAAIVAAPAQHGALQRRLLLALATCEPSKAARGRGVGIKSMEECRVLGIVRLALMLQDALALGPRREGGAGGGGGGVGGGGSGRSGTSRCAAAQTAAGPAKLSTTSSSLGEG
jgi:hypothetical protein